MRLAFLLVSTALVFAQTRGEEVFSRSCGTPYCHGSKGAGGGAPKLANRGFDEAYIASVTRAGIAGTAMQGYGSVLPRADFNAVVAYVASLNGIEPRVTAVEPPIKFSSEAARGRELFFDSTRGVERCSTCHQVQGLGIAIAPIVNAPGTIAEIRNARAPDVTSAHVDGDRFPAMVVSQGGRRTVLYDFTSLPPVMRTADSKSVTIANESAWKHAAVTKAYSDRELESIRSFLSEALARR